MVSHEIENKKRIKILFDTSVLKPSSDIYFINSDLTKFLDEYLLNEKLKISVHLPEMVRLEREYQMRLQERKLLKPIREYEGLFGYELNLTEEKIVERIQQIISDSIKLYTIDIIPLNTGKVNWEDIIHDDRSPKTVHAIMLVFRPFDRSPKTVHAIMLVFRPFKPPSGGSFLQIHLASNRPGNCAA